MLFAKLKWELLFQMISSGEYDDCVSGTYCPCMLHLLKGGTVIVKSENDGSVLVMYAEGSSSYGLYSFSSSILSVFR